MGQASYRDAYTVRLLKLRIKLLVCEKNVVTTLRYQSGECMNNKQNVSGGGKDKFLKRQV